MSSTIIPANDVKIYFGEVRVAKITSARLTISSAVRDTTNRDTQNFVTGEYGLTSWSLSGSAHLAFDDGYNIFDMYRAMRLKQKPLLKWTTSTATHEEFFGYCIIESLESGGGVGDNETYDFTFRGDGRLFEQEYGSTAGTSQYAEE